MVPPSYSLFPLTFVYHLSSFVRLTTTWSIRYLFTYQPPHLECQIYEGSDIFCSLLYPQHFEQCLSWSKCPINIWRNDQKKLNEQMKEWKDDSM